MTFFVRLKAAEKPKAKFVDAVLYYNSTKAYPGETLEVPAGKTVYAQGHVKNEGGSGKAQVWAFDQKTGNYIASSNPFDLPEGAQMVSFMFNLGTPPSDGWDIELQACHLEDGNPIIDDSLSVIHVVQQGAPPPGARGTAICYIDVYKDSNKVTDVNVGDTVKIVAYLFVPSITGCLGGTGVNGKTLDFYWKGNKIGSAVTRKGGENNWDGYAEVTWTPTANDAGTDSIVVKFEGDSEYKASQGSKSLTVVPEIWIGVISNPGYTIELYTCGIPWPGCGTVIIGTLGVEPGWNLYDTQTVPESGKVQFTGLNIDTDYGIVVRDQQNNVVAQRTVSKDEEFNKWYTLKPSPAESFFEQLAKWLGMPVEQVRIIVLVVGGLFVLAFIKSLLR